MWRIASLSLIVFAFSGCVGGGEAAAGGDGAPGQAQAPAKAAPPKFGEDSGAIEGLVVDAEAAGVPAAQVAIQSRADAYTQTTITDVAGAFSFSDVPPGDYNIYAQKLGYDSSGRTVSVAIGQVVPVTLAIHALAIQEGYKVVWSRKGLFECSTTLVGSTGPCGFLPVVGNVSYITSLWTKNNRAFVYQAAPGVMNVYNEMTWQKGSFATGDTLKVTFSYENRTTTHWFCGQTGISPVRMIWQRGDDESLSTRGACSSSDVQLPGGQPVTIDYKKGLLLRSFVNTGPMKNPATGADISSFGLAWQQNFDIWFSLFYYERAPEAYSALGDG